MPTVNGVVVVDNLKFGVAALPLLTPWTLSRLFIYPIFVYTYRGICASGEIGIRG